MGCKSSKKIDPLFFKSTIALFRVKVTNKSANPIYNLSVGYFLDLDAGYDSRKNTVSYFAEAMPDGINQNAYGGQITKCSIGNFPVIACAVYSRESNALAQSSGFRNEDLNPTMIISKLSSDKSSQYSDIADVAAVVGMRFLGETKPNESHSFVMCLGVAINKEELAGRIKEYIVDSTTGVDVDPVINNDLEIDVFPQPVSDYFEIKPHFPKEWIREIKLLDILGRRVDLMRNADDMQFNTANLTPGLYFLTITTDKEYKTIKISVCK